MDGWFRVFLGGLSIRGGHCLDCLSRLYGEPVEAVGEYLTESNIAGRAAHCENCGEHRETFRASPAVRFAA
jgi:hypothetical protein